MGEFGLHVCLGSYLEVEVQWRVAEVGVAVCDTLFAVHLHQLLLLVMCICAVVRIMTLCRMQNPAPFRGFQKAQSGELLMMATKPF